MRETRHCFLLFLDKFIGHAPVKVGSVVVGAMTCVFIATEGVAVGKRKLCNEPYLMRNINNAFRKRSFWVSELIPDIARLCEDLSS